MRHDPRRILQQRGQQRSLQAGQRDPARVAFGDHAARIVRQAGEGQGATGRLAMPAHCMDPRLQFAHRERLDQVVVRTFGEAAQLVLEGVARCQIDIAPTVLGLLGMDYDSRFYGVDVLRQPPGHERAFIGTYQLLGYLRGGTLAQLSPHRKVDTLKPSLERDQPQPALPEDPALTLQAIAYYQDAAAAFASGAMRLHGDARTSADAIAMQTGGAGR